jgi:hypothetical protein
MNFSVGKDGAAHHICVGLLGSGEGDGCNRHHLQSPYRGSPVVGYA